jgi:hypothetical protein
VTKKKSPETTNNRLARGSSRGSTRLSAQGSSGGVVCHRGSDSHLPAQQSFGAASCHRSFGSHLPAQGISGGATYHRNSSSHLPAQKSSGVGTCPVGSSNRLLAQDSSEGAACHRSSGPDENCRAEQLRKQSSGRFFLAPTARRRVAPGAPRVPAASDRMKTIKPMQKT